jgi:hypothetical protein
MSESMILLIQVGAVLTGGAGVFYWVGCKVDEWWQDKKANEAWLEHAEASRMRAEADYIRDITEENQQLRDALESMSRSHMAQTLDWCEERKRLNARATMMAQELSYDDSKKTQVIEPYKSAK